MDGSYQVDGTPSQEWSLGISKQGKELHAHWYANRENSIHSQRLEAYILKLMCLLAVNELKTEVDEDIVQKAITLCDWQLWARKFYTPIDADNKVAHMEEKIRRIIGKNGASTERKLFNLTNAKRGGRCGR